jgi:putative protease
MELLCPAGSPESLRAAVQNGANAVYLGWGDFNARRNAKNFTDQEFADAISYCHERSVRVYLTLNTLLTDRELPHAVETARKASALGVDAVLVQDWGLLLLLRAALPDLPLHASTQMSIFTSGGACEAAEDWAWSAWSSPGSAPGRKPRKSAAVAPPKSKFSVTGRCACATPANAP